MLFDHPDVGIVSDNRPACNSLVLSGTTVHIGQSEMLSVLVAFSVWITAAVILYQMITSGFEDTINSVGISSSGFTSNMVLPNSVSIGTPTNSFLQITRRRSLK